MLAGGVLDECCSRYFYFSTTIPSKVRAYHIGYNVPTNHWYDTLRRFSSVMDLSPEEAFFHRLRKYLK